MQDIQDIYKRIRELKSEQKDIKVQYKDALEGRQEYKEIKDKLKSLKERKKQIENVARQELGKEFAKLEEIKASLKADVEMLSDMAMTKLMKGETVELTDEENNIYEPVFTVRFRKASLH